METIVINNTLIVTLLKKYIWEKGGSIRNKRKQELINLLKELFRANTFQVLKDPDTIPALVRPRRRD